MVLVVSLLLMAGLLASGQMMIDAYDRFPNPGDEVTLRLDNAPSGATFRWTLGMVDVVEGPDRSYTWCVPAGFHEIRVEALQDGRVTDEAHLGLLADEHLGAYRTVRADRGAYMVTVLLQAKSRLPGVGLEETIPAGAIHSFEGGTGHAVFKRVGERLQWSWGDVLPAGTQLLVRYSLSEVPDVHAALDGRAFGLSPEGWTERRVGGEARLP